MSDFSERLESLIGGRRRISAFSRECGVPGSTIRDYLEGAVPRLDKVIQIAQAKNVHVEWLATGNGPRDIQPEADLSSMALQSRQAIGGMTQSLRLEGTRSEMVMLPKLSVEASAGQGMLAGDEDIEGFMAFKAEFLRSLGVNPNNAHVLRIRGSSMYPTLQDKDVVVIDASIIEVIDEGLYTLVLGDVVRAKRIQPLANGGLRISSDNKAEGYADEIIPPSDLDTLRIVGRIRGVLRYFPEH